MRQLGNVNAFIVEKKKLIENQILIKALAVNVQKKLLLGEGIENGK